MEDIAAQSAKLSDGINRTKLEDTKALNALLIQASEKGQLDPEQLQFWKTHFEGALRHSPADQRDSKGETKTSSPDNIDKPAAHQMHYSRHHDKDDRLRKEDERKKKEKKEGAKAKVRKSKEPDDIKSGHFNEWEYLERCGLDTPGSNSPVQLEDKNNRRTSQKHYDPLDDIISDRDYDPFSPSDKTARSPPRKIAVIPNPSWTRKTESMISLRKPGDLIDSAFSTYRQAPDHETDHPSDPTCSSPDQDYYIPESSPTEHSKTMEELAEKMRSTPSTDTPKHSFIPLDPAIKELTAKAKEMDVGPIGSIKKNHLDAEAITRALFEKIQRAEMEHQNDKPQLIALLTVLAAERVNSRSFQFYESICTNLPLEFRILLLKHMLGRHNHTLPKDDADLYFFLKGLEKGFQLGTSSDQTRLISSLKNTIDYMVNYNDETKRHADSLAQFVKVQQISINKFTEQIEKLKLQLAEADRPSITSKIGTRITPSTEKPAPAYKYIEWGSVVVPLKSSDLLIAGSKLDQVVQDETIRTILKIASQLTQKQQHILLSVPASRLLNELSGISHASLSLTDVMEGVREVMKKFTVIMRDVRKDVEKGG